MNCKVSVIVPTYKRDTVVLKRALDSIINQTYLNIEVIVIDDNATEDTFEYRDKVQKFMTIYKEDNRVIYLQNGENLGGSLSRNIGVQASNGEYVTFLDDDDMYLPHKVENQITGMIDNNLEMSFTDLKICNENGNIVDFREYTRIASFDTKTLLKYHLTKLITGTPTFMYKKESFIKIGGFPDAKVSQEFYLMLVTIEKGLKIGYIHKADVIAYRQSIGGISMGNNKLDGEERLYKFKKKYFNALSWSEKRFIKFRYNVILAVTWKRNKSILRAVKHLFIALVISPIDFVAEATRFLRLISYNK